MPYSDFLAFCDSKPGDKVLKNYVALFFWVRSPSLLDCRARGCSATTVFSFTHTRAQRKYQEQHANGYQGAPAALFVSESRTRNAKPAPDVVKQHIKGVCPALPAYKFAV